MSLFKTLLALMGSAAAAVQYLAPANDINVDLSSESAANPLQWLGANSPWFAGPNVLGISPDVPQNCHVEKAAYNVRHGSRYPDSGAYHGWLDMQKRFAPENGYTASGPLSFLPTWRTVLTNPPLQIAMESPTGSKEAFDLGYTLRTRYPTLYQEGDHFMVWANNYTRVLQTAQTFVRGFLGPSASTLGCVMSVTAKGFPGSVGNSLNPSDTCPNFRDTEGGDQQAVWSSIWTPPVLERLQALISGNLTLTEGDLQQIPYLCGFESQITGQLSPWCGVFTDQELKDYQLHNDLRYWYGVGPGSKLAANMMMPYLNALLSLLAQDHDVTGTYANGTAYTVPKLIMAFMNDGQLSELVSAAGVFDAEPPLSYTSRDDGRLFMSSRYSTMRGTIAFEKLNCMVQETPPLPSGFNTQTTPTTSNYGGSPTGIAGSNISSTTFDETPQMVTLVTTVATTVCPTPTPVHKKVRRAMTNATYIRIRLNDAVYPIPSCKDGPGSSCQLSDYVSYVAKKYAAQGNWATNCNVTLTGAPEEVKGATFFTKLGSPWVHPLRAV